MADSPEGTPTSTANKGKSGKWLAKNKWYVIGGLAGIAILVFYFVNRSNANAAGAGNTTATTPATNQGYGTLPTGGSDFGGNGWGSGTPTIDVTSPNITIRNIIRRPGQHKPKHHDHKPQKAPRQVSRQTAVHASTVAHNERSGVSRPKPVVAVTTRPSEPARRAAPARRR